MHTHARVCAHADVSLAHTHTHTHTLSLCLSPSLSVSLSPVEDKQSLPARRMTALLCRFAAAFILVAPHSTGFLILAHAWHRLYFLREFMEVGGALTVMEILSLPYISEVGSALRCSSGSAAPHMTPRRRTKPLPCGSLWPLRKGGASIRSFFARFTVSVQLPADLCVVVALGQVLLVASPAPWGFRTLQRAAAHNPPPPSLVACFQSHQICMCLSGIVARTRDAGCGASSAPRAGHGESLPRPVRHPVAVWAPCCGTRFSW